eukprot:GILJ01003794.1.p1 GENE.GILJ01003794.1~~GILJ01003794.1.p1  ORF type:complete len:923 (-),score=142.82 GILJ01003794.1:814-3309(-)
METQSSSAFTPNNNALIGDFSPLNAVHLTETGDQPQAAQEAKAEDAKPQQEGMQQEAIKQEPVPVLPAAPQEEVKVVSPPVPSHELQAVVAAAPKHPDPASHGIVKASEAPLRAYRKVRVVLTVTSQGEPSGDNEGKWWMLPTPAYDQAKKMCQEERKHFVDSSFEASDKSICYDWNKCPRRSWYGIKWQRAAHLLSLIDASAPPAIFAEGIAPEDIEQGELCDCYFLSCLAALTEYPGMVERLLVSDTFNEEGVYCVRMCKNGVWQEVLLDDMFPAYASGRGLIFSRARGPEMWVMLLEKAWAKVHGSYQRTEWGAAHEVFRDLTGAPSEFYSTKVDPAELWNRLLTAHKDGYLMTATVPDVPDQDLRELVGLVEGHVYSVLDVREVQAGDKPVKLMKIRNPHSRTEWTGDWSDNSPRWTPELRSEFNVTQADDGDFWMAFEDLIRFFSAVTICFVHSDWKYFNVGGNICADKPFAVFTVTVEESKPDNTVFLSVSQPDVRCHFDNPDYQYVSLFLHVLDASCSELVRFVGVHKDRDMHIKLSLAPGTYTVVVEAQFDGTKECNLSRDLVFSAYTDLQCKLVNCSDKYTGCNVQSIVEQAYMKRSKLEGTLRPYEEEAAEGITCSQWKSEGLFTMYYENNSTATKLVENVMLNRTNVVLYGYPDDHQTVTVEVEPSQRRLLMLRRRGVSSYSWGHQYMSMFEPQYTLQQYKQTTREKGERKAYEKYSAEKVVEYVWDTSSSYCFLIENNEEAMAFQKVIDFTLENMCIDAPEAKPVVGGENRSTVTVMLAPGEHCFFKLEPVDKWGPFSWNSSMTFGLAPVTQHAASASE